MHGMAGPAQACAVGFTSIIATQLAQTLEAGRVEGTLSRPVVSAVRRIFSGIQLDLNLSFRLVGAT